MLEPRFMRKVELTFKSHVRIDGDKVETFLRDAVVGRRIDLSLNSPLRDVSVFIDDVGEIERIPE